MAIRRAVALAALLAGSTVVQSGPVAQAAEPTLKFTYNPSFTQRSGAGYIAGANCRAEAVPATTTQVAVATSVTCWINGTSRSQAAPGGHVATFVVVATAAPIYFCTAGEAAFVETTENQGDITVVTVPKTCFLHPVGGS